MQYQHMGYRIKGFYKIASFSQKVEVIMKPEAKRKLDALTFWEKHKLMSNMLWHHTSDYARMWPLDKSTE